MSLYYLVLFIILPLILTLYLIVIFINSVYKKELSKKYMYSYGVYLFLIAIFYFGFYSQITHYKYIPASEFETSLQNIDISAEEN
jgi:hypothetical protein